jgi:hypothetical protein
MYTSHLLLSGRWMRHISSPSKLSLLFEVFLSHLIFSPFLLLSLSLCVSLSLELGYTVARKTFVIVVVVIFYSIFLVSLF